MHGFHSLLLLVLPALVSVALSQEILTLSHHTEEPQQRHQEQTWSPPPNQREAFQFLEEERVSTTSRRRNGINPPLMLYQSYPSDIESDVVGPVVNPIYPGTPAFTDLVNNVFALIFYVTDIKFFPRTTATLFGPTQSPVSATHSWDPIA